MNNLNRMGRYYSFGFNYDYLGEKVGIKQKVRLLKTGNYVFVDFVFHIHIDDELYNSPNCDEFVHSECKRILRKDIRFGDTNLLNIRCVGRVIEANNCLLNPN